MNTVSNVVDWSTVREWAAFLFMLGTAVFAWFTRRDHATQDALRAAATERAGFDKRITVIESKLTEMPTRADFHQLERTIDRFSGEFAGKIDVITEKLRPIAATSDRLQELILERK